MFAYFIEASFATLILMLAIRLKFAAGSSVFLLLRQRFCNERHGDERWSLICHCDIYGPIMLNIWYICTSNMNMMLNR